MEDEQDLPARLTALRLLHRVVADLNAARGLNATLQAVADGVVSSLGFEAAAVNVVRPDGDLEVAAVAGGEEVKRALAGRVGTRASWDILLEAADIWGSLRFLSHAASGSHLDELPSELPTWVSDALPRPEPGTWHPMDALFAPLSTPEGELVGVLSVDMPRDRRLPGPWQCELLEIFAAQAAIAIDNERLRAEALHAVERLEAEQLALRASEESFRQAFENAPSGMAVTDLKDPEAGRLVRVNDALCGLLGYPEATLLRMGLEAVVHAEDCAALAAELWASGRHELRLTRSDGASIWVSLRSSAIPDAVGEPHLLLTHVEDIEDRKRREQHLVHRASHDPLTGLPNREELRARLEQMLSSGTSLAVLFCDLDDFKDINDRYGHHTGDAVLTEVARRLGASVRDEDTVSRVGGDEFVVVAGGINQNEADDLAVRLSRTLAKPLSCDGDDIRVGASFGVSWADGDVSADAMLRAADREMYKRKRARAEAQRRAG
jgi:diguanylate cyclase (GGDEF)-like protein/PAS domain S-box-containing protein